MKNIQAIKKYNNFTITGEIPLELDNLQDIKLILHKASEEKDLTKLTIPAIYLSEAKLAFEKADKMLKEAIKEQKQKYKALEISIKELESQIKKIALDNVEVKKTPKMADKENGSIKMDSSGLPLFNTSHNLNKTIFSFTSKKEFKSLDRTKLLDFCKKNKDFNYLVEKIVIKKEIINEEKLLKHINQNGFAKLPTLTSWTEPRISLNIKKILTATEKGVFNEIEKN